MSSVEEKAMKKAKAKDVKAKKAAAAVKEKEKAGPVRTSGRKNQDFERHGHRPRRK